jgi:GH25 family lysozyme M1 (1,4-beta-N-acetylmuramidase)
VHKVQLWQYTDQGIIDGIDGYVDRNRYFHEGK